MLSVESESLSERSESQRVELAKKRHKFIRRFIIIAIVAIVLISVLILYRFYTTRTFDSYKVLDSIKRTDSENAQYVEYNGNLLKYSRDGAIGYDTSLKTQWSGSYEYSAPIVDTCGDYVAVADYGGKDVLIFDGTDSSVQLSVLYPITSVQIAAQGVVGVIMENGDSDTIQLYDTQNSNKLLVEFSTNVSEDGYPIDMALSDDATKLVTAYVNVANGTSVSNLTFYNLSEVGQNYSNKIVSSESFDGSIVSKVEFLDNNTVCAFRESGYKLYSMKQLVDEIESHTYDDTIKSVVFNDEYFGVVVEDNGKNKIVLYNLKGKEVLNKQIDFDYSQVYMAGDEVFFLSSDQCYIMRTNGSYKYSGTFENSASYIMPVNNFNKYLLVEKSKICIIKITEG